MAYSAARRSLASILNRTLSSSSSTSFSARHRFALALLNQQPRLVPDSVKIPTRFKTSGSGYSPLNDPSPNWSNRPPKETLLLDGCDYEHWLIVMEFPNDPKPTEVEMVNTYVKTLAAILGSEEEAKKKIYSVATIPYTGFGALISEELSNKLKAQPGVLWVLPDSYLDVPNKDYGGDLFVDGKVIPRPQYRFTDRQPQPSRNRPRARIDRRRETVQAERKAAKKIETDESQEPVQQEPTAQAKGDEAEQSETDESEQSETDESEEPVQQEPKSTDAQPARGETQG